MSRSDLPRFNIDTPMGVRRSLRLATAKVHQSQDSAEKNAPARDSSRKRKFDQLDPGTSSVSSGNDAAEELCSNCQRIDFEGAFQISDFRWKWHGVVVAELGKKGIDWGKTNCPMCGLFAAACAPLDKPIVADTSHYCLRVSSFLRVTGDVIDTGGPPEPLSNADFPCFVVLSDTGRLRRPSRSLDNLIERRQSSGVICPVVPATKASPQLGTRRLLPDRIDYHLLRSWCGFCTQHHRKLCTITSEEYPKALRLIDCWTKTIIGAPPNCSYVALSYVWGQQQSTKASSSKVSSENDEPRTLTSDTLPRVIKDAMIVTLELGWQYLWVDRYCIDQNNDEEKHKQINQMDKIYSCAVITIIAAAGESANYGLPGVSNTLRREQPYAMVRGQLLASTMRNSKVAIGSSRWATRGWTYQEAALSKRRLVFTDDQVFFECKRTSFSESHSVPLALFSEHLERRFLPRGFFETFRFTCGGSLEDMFWNDVERFSARELSYETDALNAFMGVANYYKSGQDSQSSPLYTYIGLPLDSDIYSSAEQPYCYGDQFVMSLLWIHEGKQVLPKRRRGFPSFSWAGWEGVASRPLGPHCSVFAPMAYIFSRGSFKPMARIVRDHGSDPELSTLPGTTIDLEAATVQGQIEILDKSDSRGPRTDFCLMDWEKNGLRPVYRSPIILPRDFLSRHKLSGGQTFFVDCVLMGYQCYMSTLEHYWLMLIEYHGAIAERIGVTGYLDPAKERFQDLLKTRRRIRLG